MIPLGPFLTVLNLKNWKTYSLQKELLPNRYNHSRSQISGNSSKETLHTLIKRLPCTISVSKHFVEPNPSLGQSKQYKF